MNKNDLKNGMILESRNGDNYIVIRDNPEYPTCEGKTALAKLESFEFLSHYTDDLKFKNHPDSDIMKVYYPKTGSVFSCSNALVWERSVWDILYKGNESLLNQTVK